MLYRNKEQEETFFEFKSTISHLAYLTFLTLSKHPTHLISHPLSIHRLFATSFTPLLHQAHFLYVYKRDVEVEKKKKCKIILSAAHNQKKSCAHTFVSYIHTRTHTMRIEMAKSSRYSSNRTRAGGKEEERKNFKMSESVLIYKQPRELKMSIKYE